MAEEDFENQDRDENTLLDLDEYKNTNYVSAVSSMLLLSRPVVFCYVLPGFDAREYALR